MVGIDGLVLTMGWTDQGLPFASSASPLAAHTSYQGAQAAAGRAENQTLRLLELYARRGPTTDAEAATVLAIERSSVNARRAPLCRRGIVVAVDSVKNGETGVINVRWGLAK